MSSLLAELRRLTEHCNFCDFLEEALRDRFVCGLKYERIQRRMLSERDLTLEKFIETAFGVEVSIYQMCVDLKVKIVTIVPRTHK